jgi:hypothetical protein
MEGYEIESGFDMAARGIEVFSLSQMHLTLARMECDPHGLASSLSQSDLCDKLMSSSLGKQPHNFTVPHYHRACSVYRDHRLNLRDNNFTLHASCQASVSDM